VFQRTFSTNIGQTTCATRAGSDLVPEAELVLHLSLPTTATCTLRALINFNFQRQRQTSNVPTFSTHGSNEYTSLHVKLHQNLTGRFQVNMQFLLSKQIRNKLQSSKVKVQSSDFTKI